MTPAEAAARLGPAWRLERVSAEAYGCPQGGWRAHRGGVVRGGYKLEHVVEQVAEWEAQQRPLVQLSFLDRAA